MPGTMTTTRCKCGTISNFGITCVRCRQEIYKSSHVPKTKEPSKDKPDPIEEEEPEED